MTTTGKVVLVTGGFDPLHIGHIEYFKAARALGDTLVVGLNSDLWLRRKKGRFFMDWANRAAIVQELKCVDDVLVFNDDDNSAIDAIHRTLEKYPQSEVLFANGGDRTSSNIPEMQVTNERLRFVFGVGGENKMNSSSWILKNWEMHTKQAVLNDVQSIILANGDVFHNMTRLSKYLHDNRAE